MQAGGSATDEIGGQIQDIQNETRKAVGMIGEISGMILKVSEIATGIAAAMEEQSAATQ